MKRNKFLSALIGLTLLLLWSCSNDDASSASEMGEDVISDTLVIVDVDSSVFVGNSTVSIVSCTLSNGTETQCYQIVTNSMAGDHEMGPWCPTHISDGEEAGGIWLEGGEVYDVDGEFVKNLADFYGDDTWLMYDADGNIYVTETEEDCINAANPNVGEAYQNFCVECIPDYINVSQSWLIPVSPVLQTVANYSGPSSDGVALNGVELSGSAPVDDILAAYTIAPFDDAGGHINVRQGYHYHAATGVSTSVEQSDGHSDLIAYAFDGHGIYALQDGEGNESTDLDECRGHYDTVRGYHYHVDNAGNNNFIDCIHGAYAL